MPLPNVESEKKITLIEPYASIIAARSISPLNKSEIIGFPSIASPNAAGIEIIIVTLITVAILLLAET